MGSIIARSVTVIVPPPATRARPPRRARRPGAGPTAKPGAPDHARDVCTCRRPSTDATTACMSRSSPSCSATAPSGNWQPPPSAATSVRSASSACAGPRIADRGQPRVRLAIVVPAFQSPRFPGPAPGRRARRGIGAEMRDAKPSRRIPADASTSASYSPASSLRRRVSTLPRMGEKRALGRTVASCAIRRTLPVPIAGASPSAATAAWRSG